jgi:hypothetical protein
VLIHKRDNDSKIKSRTPKAGVWLMRGAQPPTSAGARLFCRKPDSGALTVLNGEV